MWQCFWRTRGYYLSMRAQEGVCALLLLRESMQLEQITLQAQDRKLHEH